MERYVQERHGQIVKSVNHDPKTLAGIYLPLVLWMLGYPDRAVAIVHERDSHARRIGHPFDSGFVLTLGAWVFHYRREPEKQYACNKEIQKLARDSGLPFLSEVLAPYLSTGISLAQMGRLSRGSNTCRPASGYGNPVAREPSVRISGRGSVRLLRLAATLKAACRTSM